MYGRRCDSEPIICPHRPLSPQIAPPAVPRRVPYRAYAVRRNAPLCRTVAQCAALQDIGAMRRFARHWRYASLYKTLALCVALQDIGAMRRFTRHWRYASLYRAV
jgi:hypothetical protein